jgi:predicted RNA methylase
MKECKQCGGETTRLLDEETILCTECDYEESITAQHTPIKLHVDRLERTEIVTNDNTTYDVSGHQGKTLKELEDTTLVIVKRFNSHDELIEALKSVLDTIESYNQVKNVFNLNSAQWKKAKQALKNAE